MKHKRSVPAVAVLALAGMFMSPRPSRSMMQEQSAPIVGNHPEVALTGWSHAAGEMELP
jgi:hypothetical protein